MSVTTEPVNPTFGVSLTFPITIIGITLFAYYFYTKMSKRYKMIQDLPGPDIKVPELLYRAASLQPEDLIKYALSKVTEHTKIAKVSVGPKLFVFLYNPEDIEIILGSNVHLEKSSEYKFFKNWLGDGLLITKGNKWKYHRKLIAPTFHMSILKSFVPTFYKNSLNVCDRLHEEVGKVFDVHDYMSEATVDILLETAMGYKGKNKDDKSGFDYAMAVMKMCYATHLRHYKAWLRLEPLYKTTKWSGEQAGWLNTIHSLTGKVFENKKKEFLDNKTGSGNFIDVVEDKETKAAEESSGLKYVRDDLDENDENDVGSKKRMAFLDFLMTTCMQEGSKLSEQEVQDEINTIMFEGHDTTAAGSSFALCLLGVHHDIQDKVMQELNDIFHGTDRACTYADTLEMKYLERVILESLRLYPPVPLISREVREDVKLASGDYTIPANSTVIVTQLMLHRNPEYYPDPLKFDPDRFLPEECQKRHFYSYIPFSAGPRSCVGRKYAMLKLKVLLSTILRKYRVVSNVPESEFHLQADIILKRSNGFTLKMEERQPMKA